MVYNGEIYNYKEIQQQLASQGHIFMGHSDSEVLLALFQRHGVECFPSLNGIFAAAFWDRFENSVENCLNFVGNPENVVESVKLGLLPKEALPVEKPIIESAVKGTPGEVPASTPPLAVS